MKFLKLTADIGSQSRGYDLDRQLSGDELGEDDVPVNPDAPPVTSHTVTILDPLTRIRSFSPRKHGRVGTRIVFMSGAGLPVMETCDEVESKIAALYN